MFRVTPEGTSFFSLQYFPVSLGTYSFLPRQIFPLTFAVSALLDIDGGADRIVISSHVDPSLVISLADHT